MEGESCVKGSIIDEIFPWDTEQDQMESKSGVT